jgi:hypothetical protein
MVTWLCHLFGPLLQNFIQRFHVAKAYIDVSRALDQALKPFVTSSSFSHATITHSFIIVISTSTVLPVSLTNALTLVSVCCMIDLELMT